MAVTLDIAVPAKGDLTFDFTASLITAENTIDVLTAQELANALRDAEDEWLALSFDTIAKMSGKSNIGDTAAGIIIELLGWHIVSDKTSGKFVVSGGTTTEMTDGVDIFAVNNLVSQINIVQIGGTIATSGSGVTPQDKTDIINGVWNHADSVFILKVIKNKKALVKNGSVWELVIYDDDNSTPILTKPLKDMSEAEIADLTSGILAMELKSSV